MKKNNSTGPRSPNGKARSSRNAVRHGLLSLSPVVVAFERPEAWETHLQGILKACDPVGHLEGELAQRIALTFWRLARIAHFEAENTQFDLDWLRSPGFTGVPTVAQERNRVLFADPGDAPIRALTPEEKARNNAMHELREQLTERTKYLLPEATIALITRYEAHLERSLYRAVQELQRLQENRRSVAGGMPQRQTDSNVAPQTIANSAENP
jgi:hypothetical protein